MSVHWKDWCWNWSSNTLATWCEKLTHWENPDTGKDWGQKEKGVTEGEMVGWHHWFNGHRLGQTAGDGERQGTLVCCSPWGRKESDTTEQLNNNDTKLDATFLLLGIYYVCWVCFGPEETQSAMIWRAVLSLSPRSSALDELSVWQLWS